MGDNLKPADRRKTMQAVKGKGTRLEKRLFAMLAGMGVRGWRKNVDSIIGKPDVAFIEQHLAVFIDGCFWHGCPYCRRKLPQTNRKYWKRKIERNIALAISHNRRLRASGWAVIRIWGHELEGVTGKQAIKAKILRSLSHKE
ncbi:MAG: very short patch repair endonuclease [Chloroflexi bacterium]|nr:very short patch repair endonuclease [Chloroflexota bacterium]